MKTKVSVLAVMIVAGMVLFGSSASAGGNGVRLAANMTSGDQAMANACLAKFNADGSAGTRELLQRLAAEQYLLSKVHVKEKRQGQDLVRLEFSFKNKLKVINVYMRANCPSELVDPHLPARSAKVGS